jgi:hypothetical protein
MVIALEALYIFSTVTTKISILLFYRRLVSSSVSRTFRWIVYAAIAFVAAYFLAFIPLTFSECRPIEAAWMLSDIKWWWEHEHSVSCINEGLSLSISAIISATQDFIAFGLPLTLFSKLKIPPRQKIALAGIFVVGFL